MIHADNESGHELFFRWLGELGANYDAILLSSIDRAILTLSAPILVSGQADSSRLVGAFGSRTLASKLPDNMSVCGPCLNHWGAEIYRILTAEINLPDQAETRLDCPVCPASRGHVQRGCLSGVFGSVKPL